MSTANTSGSNYTTPPNLTGSGSVNNGGTSTRVTSNSLLRNVAVSKDGTGVFASIVIDGPYTDKAISAGTIPHDHVKPISQKITTEMKYKNRTYLMKSLPTIPQWAVVSLSLKLQKVKSAKTYQIIAMFTVKFTTLTIILILFKNTE